jgi:hypothetical protein
LLDTNEWHKGNDKERERAHIFLQGSLRRAPELPDRQASRSNILGVLVGPICRRRPIFAAANLENHLKAKPAKRALRPPIGLHRLEPCLAGLQHVLSVPRYL